MSAPQISRGGLEASQLLFSISGEKPTLPCKRDSCIGALRQDRGGYLENLLWEPLQISLYLSLVRSWYWLFLHQFQDFFNIGIAQRHVCSMQTQLL